jgi:hypothetical protein
MHRAVFSIGGSQLRRLCALSLQLLQCPQTDRRPKQLLFTVVISVRGVANRQVLSPKFIPINKFGDKSLKFLRRRKRIIAMNGRCSSPWKLVFGHGFDKGREPGTIMTKRRADVHSCVSTFDFCKHQSHADRAEKMMPFRSGQRSCNRRTFHDLEAVRWNHRSERKRARTHSLAIHAMTSEGHDWRGKDFKLDCRTAASAARRQF